MIFVIIDFLTLLCVLKFSEIMDKISEYIGKQRKNSDGESDMFQIHPK